jgi:hypothetical protein
LGQKREDTAQEKAITFGFSSPQVQKIEVNTSPDISRID